jgi:hypothetical protein
LLKDNDRGLSVRRRRIAILLGTPALLALVLYLVFRSPFRGPIWLKGAEVRAPASSVLMWCLFKGMDRLTVRVVMGSPVTPNGEHRAKPLFGELGDGELGENGDIWVYNWEDECNYFYVSLDRRGEVDSFGWK